MFLQQLRLWVSGTASCPQTVRNVKMGFICCRQHQVRLSAFQKRRRPAFSQSERQVSLLPTNVAGDECEDSAVFLERAETSCPLIQPAEEPLKPSRAGDRSHRLHGFGSVASGSRGQTPPLTAFLTRRAA